MIQSNLELLVLMPRKHKDTKNHGPVLGWTGNKIQKIRFVNFVSFVVEKSSITMIGRNIR